MKLDRHYPKRTQSEILDDEMNDEIEEIKDWVKKYTSNIDSLLGNKRSKEVKKAIINLLVEKL